MLLGVATVKSPKIIYCLNYIIFVGAQDIYVNKINPKFYKKVLPRSAPLGASTKNFAYFLSDWTSDSHAFCLDQTVTTAKVP